MSRRRRACSVCLLRLSHTAYYKKGVFEELCHLYGPRTELYRSNNAVTIDFPLSLFGLFFMRFIHICRAFSYITKMRFHYQLMRFHKTATPEPISAAIWAEVHHIVGTCGGDVDV